jgi:hypothetical protein
MAASIVTPQASLQQVVDHILSTRRISRADQSRFMSIALGKSSLSIEEQRQVNRVFDALKQGLVKVVD